MVTVGAGGCKGWKRVDWTAQRRDHPPLLPHWAPASAHTCVPPAAALHSGMPACEASHYLQMWDSDAPLKPRGFDAATSLRLRGVADIAAVSSGARRLGGQA